MNSDPMLPTSASPVATPMRTSTAIGNAAHAEQFRQFGPQGLDARHHVECGQAGEPGLLGILRERGSQ